MKTINTVIFLMIAFFVKALNKSDSIIPSALVNRYDIVIDEILADPTPSVGLPNCEWIELRNISLNEINLQNWRIGKTSTTSGPMRSFILKPDSSVIICSSGSLTEMNVYGSAISVTSFPSLSNTGDLIILIAPDGRTIHAVDYSDEWYHSDFKKQGGWSLEMIDLNNPCSGYDNWTASNATDGGTPGMMNSADAFNRDNSYPKLLRTFAIDSIHLMLYFNEPLDSAEASNISHYSINEGIGHPVSVKPLSPLFDKISLELSTPLSRNKTYGISVSGVVDCVLNEIGSYNQSPIGLFEHTDSLDVVVNEILFNPKADGVDYVELYNRSRDILNLRNLYIANLNSLGNIDNITAICEEDYLLFPEDYIVLTESPSIVKSHYLVKKSDNMIKINSLPSMNDNEGHVIVMNEHGKIIDRVDYKDDWHFKLIDNAEGVSLERINANSKSNDENNWHSSSSSVGYGTPTFKNSQAYSVGANDGMIDVETKLISPNNDGIDDIAAIKYTFDEPGYVANISLFDVNGRLVKQIQRNALCGRTGQFMWDGLNEKNQKPTSGIYIIYTEVFNLKGKVRKFKNTIVVKG